MMEPPPGPPKTATKVLDCSICGKHFNYPRSVIRHILSVHQKIKDFECEICSKKFSDKGDLNKHKAKIHKKENFCETCKVKVEDLKDHFETIHADYEFMCKLCPCRYQSLSSLNHHKKLKHKVEIPDAQNDFQCSICEKIFNDKKKLARHIKIHEKECKEESQNDSINCLELVNVKLEPMDYNFYDYDEANSTDVKMESYDNDTIEELILPNNIKHESSDNNSCDEDWSDLKNLNDYSDDYDEEVKVDVSKTPKKFNTSQVGINCIIGFFKQKNGF